MKTAGSVLQLVVPNRKQREKNDLLVDIGPRSVPWSAVNAFSKRLGIEPAELLRLIGVTARTALRRKAEGYLKPDEADRLLRIGRVLEEATRVFGEESRAAGWLSDPSPIFYDSPPLQYLDSDGGAQAVMQEIGRIGYGLFAQYGAIHNRAQDYILPYFPPVLTWRIVIPDYAAEPLSGAAIWGSRWNSPGIAMVYTASSRSLAVLEMLVHLTRERLPTRAVLIPIEIADELITGIPELPDGWDSHPHGRDTQLIGDRWVAEERSTAMFVPSAIIPAERNILINPNHARFGEIRVGEAEPHAFDRRLFGLR